ncbi:MAG: PF20097 family protein [Oscillospiraceae bacterium]
MNCPVCGNKMIRGDIIFKTPWPGALYPENPDDTSFKHVVKLFFGSKSAIGFSGADEGWYCDNCKKVVAILNTDKE